MKPGIIVLLNVFLLFSYYLEADFNMLIRSAVFIVADPGYVVPAGGVGPADEVIPATPEDSKSASTILLL